MKIVILDGRLTETPKSFGNYMEDLNKELEGGGHSISHFVLKDLDIHHCIGCFDCWVKTPGQCVFDDASRAINHEIINADFLLFATPLVMGFASYELKRKMDRIIPLIHPYLTIDKNELHHMARYEKYPLVGLLMHPDISDTPDDIYNTSEIFARTALNLKSKLIFAVTTSESIQNIRNLITDPKMQEYNFNRNIQFHQREKVGGLKQLTVFNGSPRGKKGNTPILLSQFTKGFSTVDGRKVETYDLAKTKEIPNYVDAFQRAESVLIGFPLYTDGMPGIVKEFIDSLLPLTRNSHNPPIAFLVQSGFGENHHSRYVQRYLESLSKRLNSPYIGTMVRGGCEGIRMMPQSMTKKIFDVLEVLGRQMATNGSFTDESLIKFGSREKYPQILMPFYKMIMKTPMMNWYWNSQLKKNGAFGDRFAQPYK